MIELDGNLFKLKRAYDVWDKESLKQFILENGEYGIKDDQNLELCYEGIERDVEELISECWIRVLKVKESNRGAQNKDKESRIFFPRDLAEKEVEFSKAELPDNCSNYVADLWKEMNEGNVD